MKKLLLGLGTLTMIAIPVITVISCGEDDEIKVVSPLQKLKNEYIRNHSLTTEELKKVNGATTVADLKAKTIIINKVHLKSELKTLLGDVFASKISELGMLADKYGDTGSRKKELRGSSKTKGIVRMLKLLSNLNSKGLKSVIGSTPEEFDENYNTVIKLLPELSAKLPIKYLALVKGILYGFQNDAMKFGELPVIELVPAVKTGSSHSKAIVFDFNDLVKLTLKNGFFTGFMNNEIIVGVLNGVIGAHKSGAKETNLLSIKLFGQETDASVTSFKAAEVQKIKYDKLDKEFHKATPERKEEIKNIQAAMKDSIASVTSFDKTGVFDKMFTNGLFSMNQEEIHTMGIFIRGFSSVANSLKESLSTLTMILSKFVTFSDSIAFDTANGRTSISSIINKLLSKGLDKITIEESSNLFVTVRVTMAADGTRVIKGVDDGGAAQAFAPVVIAGNFGINKAEGLFKVKNNQGILINSQYTMEQVGGFLLGHDYKDGMTVEEFQKAVILKFLHSDLFAP
ncbi:MAG: hypothetical protein KAG14_04145, partial [Mycoplasmataceae bacterium]|nr:hypothetical protein [Mycoplasmataceae bacterium]